MSKGRSLRRFMKEHREIHKISKFVGILYGVIYYISTGLLSFERVKAYNQSFASDLIKTSTAFSAPLIFEPIAFFRIPPMIILEISPFNLLLMLLIIYLVYKNMIIILIGHRYPRVCQLVRDKGNLMAVMPMLITGIVCLFLMAINLVNGPSSGAPSNILVILYWIIPVSLVMLVYGIIQGYRSLHLHY